MHTLGNHAALSSTWQPFLGPNWHKRTKPTAAAAAKPTKQKSKAVVSMSGNRTPGVCVTGSWSYRGKCSRLGSNWRPWDYETHALPTAPQDLVIKLLGLPLAHQNIFATDKGRGATRKKEKKYLR